MSCGRLSRAPEASTARFDEARKGSNALFVQPFSHIAMTLIITSLAEDALIQVSDRKLTYPNGSVASDYANKAICVDCADARCTVAYTGLARVGNAQTDHWLLDYLTASRAASK